MTSQKELSLANKLIVIFLVIGVLSYAITAFSAKEVESGPNRIMFTCDAGKVLFTHGTHAGEDGYGVACADCHHHPEEPEDGVQACGDCHNLAEDGSMPASCLDCHDASDYEGTEMVGRADAFHNQCIGCHKENDVEVVECSACHVMVQ